MAQRAAVVLFVDLVFVRSYAAEKIVERIKALKPAAQDLLIGNSFAPPTFEHPINSDAFSALKFFVIQVSVVNHFGDLACSVVLNTEALNQGFKSAIVSAMSEISVEHIE